MSKIQIESLLNRAQNAQIVRDYPLATKLLKTVLEEEPSNTTALFQLASCYDKSQQNEKARDAYLNLLRADSGNFEAMLNLGAVFGRLGQYDNSIAILKKARDTGKETPDLMYNMGLTYKLMGNYAEAADCFKAVVSQNPHDVLAYNHLGFIEARRGDHKKALQMYSRALTEDPNHPVLHYNAALSYIAMNKPDDARRSFENALRARPGWNEALEGYASLCIRERQYADAQEIVSQGLNVHPDNLDLMVTQGRLYVRTGDYAEAEKVYKRVLEKRPEDMNVLDRLEKVYEKQNRNTDAIALLKRMSEVNPPTPEQTARYTHILINQNRLDEAEQNISQMRQKNPDDVIALDLLAQYYTRSEQDGKARGCLKKISELEPNYVEADRNCAIQLSLMGRYDDAILRLTTYLDKNPADIDGLMALSRSLEAQEKYAEALHSCQTVLSLQPGNAEALSAVSRFGGKLVQEPDSMAIVSNILTDSDSNSSAEQIQESIKMYEETVGSLETVPEYTGPFDITVSQDDDEDEKFNFDDMVAAQIENEIMNDNDDDVFNTSSVDLAAMSDKLDTLIDKADNHEDDLLPPDMPIEFTPQRYSQINPDEDTGVFDVDGTAFERDEIVDMGPKNPPVQPNPWASYQQMTPQWPNPWQQMQPQWPQWMPQQPMPQPDMRQPAGQPPANARMPEFQPPAYDPSENEPPVHEPQKRNPPKPEYPETPQAPAPRPEPETDGFPPYGEPRIKEPAPDLNDDLEGVFDQDEALFYFDDDDDDMKPSLMLPEGEDYESEELIKPDEDEDIVGIPEEASDIPDDDYLEPLNEGQDADQQAETVSVPEDDEADSFAGDTYPDTEDDEPVLPDDDPLDEEEDQLGSVFASDDDLFYFDEDYSELEIPEQVIFSDDDQFVQTDKSRRSKRKEAEKHTLTVVRKILHEILNGPLPKNFRSSACMFRELRKLIPDFSEEQRISFYDKLEENGLEYVVERLQTKGLLAAASTLLETGGMKTKEGEVIVPEEEPEEEKPVFVKTGSGLLRTMALLREKLRLGKRDS